MNISEISRHARLKGLNLVGTGDFTHPLWLKELRRELEEVQDEGVFQPVGLTGSGIRFILSCEVSTIFDYQGDTKKIHHIILTPQLKIAEEINGCLSKYGNLESDGRPILNMSAPQLVEEIIEISSENVVFPAHVWTPWFSLFGAFSGFNKLEDCYQDMTKYIRAVETGLSSDPSMNYRLSALDKFALVSNSDSHSSWPWRIGREANVFELKTLTYHEITDAIKCNDPRRFKFTIETDPAYGKYHWTGHRKCGVSFSPSEAVRCGNVCPVCRKKLTKGVAQRVEELADRTIDFRPTNVPKFFHLLPLSEIIGAVLGATFPGVQSVWGVYNLLISRFGNEYTVLLDTEFEEMAKIVDPRIAELILKVRNDEVRIIPGYDGLYGQLVILHSKDDDEGITTQRQSIEESHMSAIKARGGQSSLSDFM